MNDEQTDESRFLTEIAKKRRKAIQNSDEKYSKQFLEEKEKKEFDPRPLLIVAGILVILLGTLLVWRVVERPSYIIQDKQDIINQHDNYNTYNLINETNVDVTNKYTIKGDREMICLTAKDNPDKSICYKIKEEN